MGEMSTNLSGQSSRQKFGQTAWNVIQPNCHPVTILVNSRNKAVSHFMIVNKFPPSSSFLPKQMTIFKPRTFFRRHESDFDCPRVVVGVGVGVGGAFRRR